MVPKPAHNGCESWLQSVWAVRRHLSQYSSAADAFAAPDTCKQLTPQISVVCGGARETTISDSTITWGDESLNST